MPISTRVLCGEMWETTNLDAYRSAFQVSCANPGSPASEACWVGTWATRLRGFNMLPSAKRCFSGEKYNLLGHLLI